jgi:glucose/mannose-6-phosphate isomerase
MQNLILDFPNQLAEGINIAKQQNIELPRKPKNIIICGLGGSGIGAEIIKQWLYSEAQVQITVCHNYHLPSYANENTLVIACSYSGNTEETLSALNQAIALNTMVVGITSGGKMSTILNDNNFQKIIIPGGLPPRSALAYPLSQLARIFDQLKLSKSLLLPRIAESISFLKKHQDDIASKAVHLLARVGKKQVLLYSEEPLKPVLLRTCQQINENGKELAFYNVIPEMNHNEIVGWAQNPVNLFVIFLRSEKEFDRNRQRLDFTEKIVRSKTDNVSTIDAIGANLIQQTLYLIHLFDWFSLFVAENKDIDAVEVNIIDQLKEELTKK